MDHSSGFIAAIAADDEDDNGDYENGRITVTFVSYFQVCKTDLSSEIKKRHCQLYQKHGSIRFCPTMLEFQHLVKDFVEMKSMKTRFTDNRPEYD